MAESVRDDTPFYNPTAALITYIIPLIIFASQSLHMRYALRPLWRLSKLGHIVLRIFFPESIVWFVGREEWERRWLVREIERRMEDDGRADEYDEGSTLQKLMAVQAGRVYFTFVEGSGNEDGIEVKVERGVDDQLPVMPEVKSSPARRGGRENQSIAYSPRHHNMEGGRAADDPPYSPLRRPSAMSATLGPPGDPYRHHSPDSVSPLASPIRSSPPYPVSEYDLSLEEFTAYPTPTLPRPYSQQHLSPPRPLPSPPPPPPPPPKVATRPPLHRHNTSTESQTTADLLKPSTAIKQLQPQQRTHITWTLHLPAHLRRLVATDIPLYFPILHLLPPGSPTYLNHINFHLSFPPDLTTILLIAQLIWAITAVALRHTHSPQVSLLEMYVIFAYVAFLFERVILTGCRGPAWGRGGEGGYVIVKMRREDYVHEVISVTPHGLQPGGIANKSRRRRRVHQYFYIPLVLLGMAYPAVLIAYAARIYKSTSSSNGTESVPGSTPPPGVTAVLGVVVGVYILAVVGFLGVQIIERRGHEPVGHWTRWMPKAKWVLWGLVGLGRLIVGVWGVWQVVSPGKGKIKSGWEGWWGWPHIGG